MLPEARQALKQVERAIEVAQRASRGEIGSLDIGFVGSASYGILPIVLQEFRDCYPDVRVNLREMTTTRQLQALTTSSRSTLAFFVSAFE